MTPLKSFASTDRFITEIASPSTLRPGYVLIGDEIFLYDRCRKAVLATLAPEDTRDTACGNRRHKAGVVDCAGRLNDW